MPPSLKRSCFLVELLNLEVLCNTANIGIDPIDTKKTKSTISGSDTFNQLM